MLRLALILVPLALSAGAAFAQQGTATGAGMTQGSTTNAAPAPGTTGINGPITNGSIIGSNTPTTSNGAMPDVGRPPDNAATGATRSPTQLSRNQRKQQQNGVSGSQSTVPDLSVTPNGTGGQTPNGVSAPPAIPPTTVPP